MLTDDDKFLKPPYFVRSTLFQSLRNSVKDHINAATGMTYVYYGPRRTGKTSAGVAILEFILEVLPVPVPCKFIDSGSSMRHSVRKELGVPEEVHDRKFVTYLCHEVLKMTNGYPSSKDVYSNALCQVPPVFIIDNVRSFSSDDQDFLEILYKACYSGRILLFLLTNEEEIANMICGINGKVRIKPLSQMVESEESWVIEKDVFLFDMPKSTEAIPLPHEFLE